MKNHQRWRNDDSLQVPTRKKCDVCGRPRECLMVRRRVAGKATAYKPGRVPVCHPCRVEKRGTWKL